MWVHRIGTDVIVDVGARVVVGGAVAMASVVVDARIGDARQLGDRKPVSHVVPAGAAILLGKGTAHKAELAEAGHRPHEIELDAVQLSERRNRWSPSTT